MCIYGTFVKNENSIYNQLLLLLFMVLWIK